MIKQKITKTAPSWIPTKLGLTTPTAAKILLQKRKGEKENLKSVLIHKR